MIDYDAEQAKLKVIPIPLKIPPTSGGGVGSNKPPTPCQSKYLGSFNTDIKTYTSYTSKPSTTSITYT
jgi:hypothetical protein